MTAKSGGAIVLSSMFLSSINVTLYDELFQSYFNQRIVMSLLGTFLRGEQRKVLYDMFLCYDLIGII
jgi:hypothetical protein